MRLSFVLAESALELIPKEIRRSPAVASDSRRRGVDPSRILLDRSFHHAAMSKLKDSEKRGRPDLVHAAMLSVTGTPLYLDGLVKVYVHTRAGLVVDVTERTRIPKNYLRFRGLMEKALVEKPDHGLVKTTDAGMRDLLKSISPDEAFGLSVQGQPMKLEELAKAIVVSKNPCVVVGGFPHGHFSEETLGLLDELVRIDSKPLEAHVVASRVIYEIEKVTAATND